MRILGTLIVLLIIIGGAWYLFGGGSSSTTNVNVDQTATTTDQTATTTTTTSINPQSQNVTVTYTDQGFSPKSVSIPEGATVTFVNNSAHNMWIASAPHPSHTGYDGTSRTTHCAAGYTGAAPFDECKAVAKGESYAFTFTKVGAWPYHNHVLDEDFGSVTVTALTQNGGITASTTASTTIKH